MAILRIRPVDHLVLPYWQAQNKLSGSLIEGSPRDFRTVVRVRRLQSDANKLGYNLDDETVRQLQARSDADEAWTI